MVELTIRHCQLFEKLTPTSDVVIYTEGSKSLVGAGVARVVFEKGALTYVDGCSVTPSWSIIECELFIDIFALREIPSLVKGRPVYWFLDSVLALSLVDNMFPEGESAMIWEVMAPLSRGFSHLNLSLVPEHMGIDGNESANKKAKSCGRLPVAQTWRWEGVSFGIRHATITRELREEEWSAWHDQEVHGYYTNEPMSSRHLCGLSPMDAYVLLHIRCGTDLYTHDGYTVVPEWEFWWMEYPLLGMGIPWSMVEVDKEVVVAGNHFDGILMVEKNSAPVGISNLMEATILLASYEAVTSMIIPLSYKTSVGMVLGVGLDPEDFLAPVAELHMLGAGGVDGLVRSLHDLTADYHLGCYGFAMVWATLVDCLPARAPLGAGAGADGMADPGREGASGCVMDMAVGRDGGSSTVNHPRPESVSLLPNAEDGSSVELPHTSAVIGSGVLGSPAVVAPPSSSIPVILKDYSPTLAPSGPEGGVDSMEDPIVVVFLQALEPSVAETMAEGGASASGGMVEEAGSDGGGGSTVSSPDPRHGNKIKYKKRWVEHDIT
ncbi:hypothetical protein HOY80DRAFT_1045492 [Tuber brumale]|nr:hypothetical protein HOY80DRAFT_1045492 [Tuber brumale]